MIQLAIRMYTLRRRQTPPESWVDVGQLNLGFQYAKTLATPMWAKPNKRNRAASNHSRKGRMRRMRSRITVPASISSMSASIGCSAVAESVFQPTYMYTHNNAQKTKLVSMMRENAMARAFKKRGEEIMADRDVIVVVKSRSEGVPPAAEIGQRNETGPRIQVVKIVRGKEKATLPERNG